MMASVLVCGSIAFDTITLFEGHFKEHILAENIKSLSVSFFVPTMRKDFGGCAGNIAYSLNMLGAHAIPVATVGKDGYDYIQHFDHLGIDTKLIKVLPEMFTAQCHITTDLDGNQIAAFHPGAMSQSAVNIIEKNDATWAIVGPDSKEGMFAHARRLHEQGIPFIFDLGQAMPLFDKKDIEEMVGLAQAMTLNDYEASVVEQRLDKSISELSHHLEAIIVTRGAEGASLYIQGEETKIPPCKAEKVCDPTGCGDAHRGGVLYGLISGWSWYDSACLGSLMGTLKIQEQGPQNYSYTRTEITAKLQEAYGIALDN
nr:carbohydrate kinase family protein [Pelistega sp. MC2]